MTEESKNGIFPLLAYFNLGEKCLLYYCKTENKTMVDYNGLHYFVAPQNTLGTPGL